MPNAGWTLISDPWSPSPPFPQSGLGLPLGNYLPPCPTAHLGGEANLGLPTLGKPRLLILSEGTCRPPSPPMGLGTHFSESLHPEWNEMDMRKCWRHSFPHTGFIQGRQLISCSHSEAWPLGFLLLQACCVFSHSCEPGALLLLAGGRGHWLSRECPFRTSPCGL